MQLSLLISVNEGSTKRKRPERLNQWNEDRMYLAIAECNGEGVSLQHEARTLSILELHSNCMSKVKLLATIMCQVEKQFCLMLMNLN